MRRGKIKLFLALITMSLMTNISSLAGEWKQREDKWQYILEDGREQKNSWLKAEDGKWYHFDENGIMNTGWYQDTDQKWYYLGTDGSMASGWVQINKVWYYMNSQSGELLLNGVTPDGYRVNGSGEWDRGSSIYDRDDSSDNRIHKDYSLEEGGNNNPGQENGGSETPGQSEPVSGENPWENKSPVILTQSGIVSVLGIPYAVISFSDQADGQENYHYSIAGKEATSSVTPVNTSGRIVKIPLPDENTHTLTITSGKWTVATVLLKKPGSSITVEKEIAEADFAIPNDIPYLVLANETIPLTQYIKFIRLGNSLFIKPGKTTADSVPNHSLKALQTQTIKTTSAQNLKNSRVQGLDAVTSATVVPPISLEGKDETATIAVLFDMIANHMIVNNLGMSASLEDPFLAKWSVLDKKIALNKDFSLYTEAQSLKNRNWKYADKLPRYVKYLTDKANYGTKNELLTGKTDNTNPPELTIEPSLKGQSVVIQLSEENETWYRSITEIEVPYSDRKTFYYQENNTLSEDGKKIVLGVDSISGPMNYEGTYRVTIHAYGFEDTTGTISVLQSPPAFTPTWDNSSTRLKLKADFTYYTDRIKKVSVNGVLLKPDQYSFDLNNLFVPYRYLVKGKNTFEVQADGYMKDVFEFDSPESFVIPKKAANISVEEVVEGQSAPIVFHIDTCQEGSEEMQWLHDLDVSHLNLSNKYGAIKELSLEKEGTIVTVTAAKTSISAYYDYTLQFAVPGYDIVTIPFKPVIAAPAITQQWSNDNYSLKLTSANSGYLSNSGARLILDGTELNKGEGADYTSSYGEGIEIFAHNFQAGKEYKIEIMVPTYGTKVIEGICPEDLIIPLPAPLLGAKAVTKGNGVTVEASGDFLPWLDKISSITVIGTSGSGTGTFEKTENGFILNSDKFAYSGNYTITVKADGYRNAQTTVTILNTVTIIDTINYDEDRLELAASDSYFYNDMILFLNGVKLEKNKGYTVNGYKMIYIPANLLTETENHIVLRNDAYEKVELTTGQFIASKTAPKLRVEKSLNGELSVVLCADDADRDWMELLDQSHISVKRSSSNQVVEGFAKNASNELTIELKNPLSYYYSYTVTAAVPGYRSSSITFTPNQTTPQIDAEWLDNGDLQLSTDSYGYFSSSYSSVYLDGNKLVKTEDYSLKASNSPYSLTILAKNFTPGDHLIEIRYTGSSNYLPYEVTVTVPEIVNSLKLEEVEMVLETPEVTELLVEKPIVVEESGEDSTLENGQKSSEGLPAGETKAEQEAGGDSTTEENGQKSSEELPAGETKAEQEAGKESLTEETEQELSQELADNDSITEQV